MANWLIVGGGIMYDVYKCSDCGYEAAESRTDHGIKQEMADFNYCPNCGKKFDYVGNEAFMEVVDDN